MLMNTRTECLYQAIDSHIVLWLSQIASTELQLQAKWILGGQLLLKLMLSVGTSFMQLSHTVSSILLLLQCCHVSIHGM